MKLSKFWHKATREAADTGGGTPPAEPVTPAVEPPVEPAPGPDLSFIPTDFHVDGAPDLGKFTAHYQDLVARDAQRAQAEAEIPREYTFALPDGLSFSDIEGAEGFKVELTPDDPLLKPLYSELGEVLKEARAPAGAAGKLMGVLARYQATMYADAMKAMEKDMAALGTPTQQEARIASVTRAIETRLPAEEATALKASLTSAKAITALEKLLGPQRGSPTAQPAPPKSVDDLAAYYATPSK